MRVGRIRRVNGAASDLLQRPAQTEDFARTQPADRIVAPRSSPLGCSPLPAPATRSPGLLAAPDCLQPRTSAARQLRAPRLYLLIGLLVGQKPGASAWRQRGQQPASLSSRCIAASSNISPVVLSAYRDSRSRHARCSKFNSIFMRSTLLVRGMYLSIQLCQASCARPNCAKLVVPATSSCARSQRRPRRDSG